MKFSAMLTVKVTCIGALCTMALTACSQDTNSASASSGMQFVADPSLMEPAAQTTYEFSGTYEGGASGALKQPLGSPTPHQPAEQIDGSFIVQDGLLIAAELDAQVHDSGDLHFELTEPVMFERRGEITDHVVGVGLLTINAAVYADTRVLLQPRTDGSGMSIGVTIEVPESLILLPGHDQQLLRFTLTSH